MHKKLLKLAAAALALCLVVPTAGAVTTNDDGEIMIRVGLASAYYHNATGELEAAHLENEDGYGAGYRFGYYDGNLDFVELGYTDRRTTQIAVLKSENLWYGYSSSMSKNTYGSSIHSDILVGCYHVLVDEGFRDFEDAQDAAEDYADGFVAYIDGEYQVRAGSFETKEDALRYGESGEVVGTSSYGLTVVETGTNTILFQYDEGSNTKLAVQPGVDGARETRTWFNNYHYWGGFEYFRRTGGNVTVVNVLTLEDYVNGVICYEMGPSWPLEALKAQAVCARTYALRNMGTHSSYGFDICNSTYCQVYRGMGNGSASYSPSQTSMQAVEETEGLVVTYNGKLAETPYSASFGGASEDAYYVWGSDTTNTYPYLCGVEDPYEDYDSSWTVSYTASELEKRLQSYGYGTSTSLDYLELEYSKLGNVIAVTIHWKNGQTNSIYPSGSKAIRSVFDVSSIRFTVNGETVNPAGKSLSGRSSTRSTSSSDLNVNGKPVDSLDGMYIISGNGTTSPIGENPYVISGSGTVSALEDMDQGGNTGGGGSSSGGSNQGGGTVTVSGSSYVFEGAGNGHQIGMSQWGANSMAKQGFDFEEIVTFYYPGVKVTRY